MDSVTFPAWLVASPVDANMRGASKKLFLWIEAEYFTRKNICDVFRKLSLENAGSDLQITAYSDQAMIKRAVGPARRFGFIDFSEDAKGRRARNEMAAMYTPATKGYFRAYYYRVNGREWFRYSEDPQSERYSWIDLTTGTPKDDVVMTLIEAVRFGDVQTAKRLIDQGINRDVRRRTGNGLIRQQVKQNHKEMLRLLINAGENINERDEYTMTALMRAAENGDTELATALLDCGADIDARANHGETARLEYPDVVTLLVERGADLKKTGIYGTTALMFAALYCDLKGINLLALKGSDSNARDRQGRTAIFYVNTKSDDIGAVVRALVRIGADVNAKDRNDETALIRAADSFHAEVDERLALINALLKNGADANLRNSTGHSALDIARKSWGENNKITQLLEGVTRKK